MSWDLPDFIFFRRTNGGLLTDIIDPHTCSQMSTPPGRAAAMAQFVKVHGDSSGRIELVINANANAKDPTGKRLNPMNEQTGKKVAEVTMHGHPRQLFESA